MKPDQIILGIDPGTVILGYGLISITAGNPSLITMGVLRLSKLSDPLRRLGTIFDRVTSLIDEYKPTTVAIEAPFYGKNVQSMLKLGRAQGVALAAAITKDLTVHEYAPRKVKQAITGNGNASKEQVAMMVQQVLKHNNTSALPDATDAVAVALCHFYQSQNPTAPSGTKSWEEFIRKNPDRIH
ncbi:MAG: crossover junction endodeoxyribonuclease RuvC [Bacteroidales bacterium]|jgi:crossover junction endodeoxyribonuclease RuvC|nr:crossover junction endodeoxyribonuclease RuvC [Bacteroidales bacterium]MDD2571197.1 crossover junction endodeoxyribonuclease RuvC [Bacteroidales bacterium]MDD2813732.1 crossover junction endodeoxyribonuclease RuvC [Bacteroidales bacterium]MDD3385490.1 crossover junction endodeoxyribonuclease RuvC [Bacteroidales bacterium]MDD3872112.1 crossover junction endodeoxyribonuclease RuvC [Bacteroidales bacterium]